MTQSGPPFSGCFEFTSPGATGDFDLHANLDGLVFEGGCSCGAQGNLANPKFDTAKTFDCLVEQTTLGLRSIIGGKAVGSTKIAGHVTSSSGLSSLFTCRRQVNGLGCP